MLLAILILVGTGLYIFLRRKVQVSSSFAIQGRSAQQIGVALILGGLLSDLVPTLLDKVGLVKGMVSGLIFAIAIIFASLVCTAVIAVREKRRQARAAAEPPPGDNTKA